jgi:hypothetical protein
MAVISRRNRRYRDIEFDLEEDRACCLWALEYRDGVIDPKDARRVGKIFAKPTFYAGRPSSGNIIQGAVDDHWFLSAVATVSTRPGLIEKICVARDEKVGVYGFIFFTDLGWVDVIIDE